MLTLIIVSNEGLSSDERSRGSNNEEMYPVEEGDSDICESEAGEIENSTNFTKAVLRKLGEYDYCNRSILIVL